MSGRACVVVLNWNGRDYIRDCVRSALAQTYPDFRVIVVDNGSPGAGLYRREVFEAGGLFGADVVVYYEALDLAWRARLAGWEARYAPGSVVHHKYYASSARRSPWKTYQGERNRIWNLAQNYPS